MIKLRLVARAVLLSMVAAGTAAGQGVTIPVRALSPAKATMAHAMESIGEIRVLTDGRILVNDTAAKRLVAWDAALATPTNIADTTAARGRKYPIARNNPLLIPYVADSTLLVDLPSQGLILIDPNWTLGRVMALPKPGMAGPMTNQRRVGLTAGGAMLMQTNILGINWVDQSRPDPILRVVGYTPPALPPGTDSMAAEVAVLRADFETRRVDTVAKVATSKLPIRGLFEATGRQLTSVTEFINPLGQTVDDWAVTSGGDAAVVRGHDYHIDWYLSDGTRDSTSRLPYDWHSLSDEAKQSLIDATRRTVDSLNALGFVGQVRNCPNTAPTYRSALDVVTLGKFANDPEPGCQTTVVTALYVPVSELKDYLPPIRRGAVLADADNNIWILPTTSLAAAKGDGPVYDVVSRAKGLHERVRLPLGRQIAGFGPGGVVYLKWRDPATGSWLLERRQVVRD